MTTVNSRNRLVPVFVVAVVAMIAALASVAANEPGASADGHRQSETHTLAAAPAHHATPPPRHLNPAKLAFHDDMRKLWEDHITWTRLAIVTFFDGSAGFDATAARLLQNQADIGDAIKPFYGEAAGDQLTALLHDHITIAVELLQAAKAGDPDQIEDASNRWYANADDIADFLAAADPKHWPQDTMRAAMKTHLDQTLAEALHELGGDYAASVADYEEIHHHILEMADLLSNGIIQAFPRHFRH
ncbi:MAG TPA: hypothetical protein VEX15_20140 [Nocardioidaceae bacterium]|nr:hypothetical protein [Nocardioidaceae bacterium]